ncbi:type II secretion system F family protein [Streptomyces sp. NPDC048290]|uniref:type II secretion system F family protein n=1 Tax=Streptomyces sp. NPDC048290 TaxID=3155811 RepID=UPI003434C29B
MGEVGTWAALACVGVVVLLMGGGQFPARRARLLFAGGGGVGHGPPRWPWQWSAWPRWWRAGPGVEWWAPVAGLVLGMLGGSLLPVVAGAAGMPVVRRIRRAREARRRRERRAAEVIALCGALAGEVRAGRQPGDALRCVARHCDGLGTAHAAVLAAARFGGDIPGELAGAARQPGAEGLLGLSACWRVSVDQGAGLAAGLDRLDAALRAQRDRRADLRAQLAGARATALMLAGLPVAGLLLGTALGADPLHVLLHTGPGLVCLAVGLALEGAGLWWALRIVRRAEAA